MLPQDLETLSKEKREILYNELSTIFNNISSRFMYAKDSVVWNVRDHWENYNQIPDRGTIVGDCDCFALACRKECRKNSIPSRLIFCKVAVFGEFVGHLVLECAGFILDCNQTKVVSNLDLPYKWQEISGYERGDCWHAVSV
jgi:predicted transglutaminase-like cysteine proteinase